MSSVHLPTQRSDPFGVDSQSGISTLVGQSGLAAIALGIASGIPIQGLGKLFLGELVLMAISPVVVLLLFGLSDRYGRMARTLLIAMIVSWLGYLISDMIRDTPSNDYLRGWSRWIAMGASFATLAWIGSKNIMLLAAFLIGLSIGSCIAPFLSFGGVGIIQYWKFYAGIPICILALVIVSPFRSWVSIAALMGLAVVSVALDTRSVALLCMITAGVTWLSARRSAKNRLPLAPVSKASMLVAAIVVFAVMVVSIYSIQRLGERYGYTERFQKSNSTRLISATVTWSAIKKSPMIGYGSWPRDSELARERDRMVAKAKGVPTFRMASQDDLIIAHSQILQGWLEGGLLGLTFFLVLGWNLAKQLLWQTFKSPKLPLTSVIVFVQLHCAWHLVFSPFSGAQRVYISAACVFICYVAEQSTQLESLRRHVAHSYLRRTSWAS